MMRKKFQEPQNSKRQSNPLLLKLVEIVLQRVELGARSHHDRRRHQRGVVVGRAACLGSSRARQPQIDDALLGVDVEQRC